MQNLRPECFRVKYGSSFCMGTDGFFRTGILKHRGMISDYQNLKQFTKHANEMGHSINIFLARHNVNEIEVKKAEMLFMIFLIF